VAGRDVPRDDAGIHSRAARARKALYWLPGLAPDGTAVFAKRAVTARTILERTIYEDVLPRLPLSAPHYYGSWLDEPHGWLFLEDVGAQAFSRHDPEHRAIAARWVGTLHTEAAGVPGVTALPDGGPARYLQHLREARRWSQSAHRRPAGRIAVLDACSRGCDAIEAGWARVGELRGRASAVVR
jgi:hypothetical protein